VNPGPVVAVAEAAAHAAVPGAVAARAPDFIHVTVKEAGCILVSEDGTRAPCPR